MKILVLSDSHSSLSLMRRYVEAVKPDCILHLGDYYEDGAVIAEENPNIDFYQVPGNCDAYRVDPGLRRTLMLSLDGVKIMMTHGHDYHVKMTTAELEKAARKIGADLVAYGHTHIPDCEQHGSLWVLNPGSCGYGGGTAALVVTDRGKIRSCEILSTRYLEDAK